MKIHSKRRFWIEVEDAQDFSHQDNFVLMRREDFERLHRLLLQAKAGYSFRFPQEFHFWNMIFRSDAPYDA